MSDISRSWTKSCHALCRLGVGTVVRMNEASVVLDVIGPHLAHVIIGRPFREAGVILRLLQPTTICGEQLILQRLVPESFLREPNA
jgi:hypothetical protein